MIKTSEENQKLGNCAKLNLLLQQIFDDPPSADWVRMSALKNAMLNRDPAFDEKEYGFAKFSDFVTAHPHLVTKFSEESSDYLVRFWRNRIVRQNGKQSKNGSARGPVTTGSELARAA